MARRKRRTKEQYTDYAWEIVAPHQPWPPSWLLIDGMRMKVSMIEEAPEEFQDFQHTAGLNVEGIRKNRRHLWGEIRERLAPDGTGQKIYDYANTYNIWGEALKYIDVLAPNGEPVAWYDLDKAEPVQYATLYDLIYEKQPMIVDDRKLFMMTEAQWEAGDYPPEVGGKTTSKEAAAPAKEEAIPTKEEATPPPQVVESIRVVEAKVLSQHQSFKAADKAARKNPNAFIIHEAETSRTNERWLVAVPPGG